MAKLNAKRQICICPRCSFLARATRMRWYPRPSNREFQRQRRENSGDGFHSRLSCQRIMVEGPRWGRAFGVVL
jgi:hypothetical protein